MRFFHLSDLHIGRQLHFYSLAEDQREILDQIVRKAKELRPDAVLISGDVYDKAAPSAQAVEIFDEFLYRLAQIQPAIPVLIIAGNHDSAQRLGYASRLLAESRIYIAGHGPEREGEYMERVVLEDEYGPVHFYLLPFLKPSYVRGLLGTEAASAQDAVRLLLERETMDPKARSVLLTHQFYTANGTNPEQSDSESIQVGGLQNVDVSVLEAFDYAAMGHIHRGQSMGESRFRYCGTPLKYSVSERKDRKTLTLVTLKEKGTAPVIEEIPLVPLRDLRQEKGTLEEILSRNGAVCEDYVSVILTDEVIPYQARERLEKRFPHLLEVRIENSRTRKLQNPEKRDRILTDPMQVFGDFFVRMQGRKMEEEERKMMEQVFQKVKEDQE